MGKIKQRRPNRRISAWSLSAEFRAIGRAAIRAFNAGRHLLPQCNAIAKSTGYQCGNLARPNGKCRIHGGLTPSGDQWHVRQLPAGKTAIQKFDRKLAKADREDRARRRKLARATDIERAAYAQWLWSHPAGNAARRASRRLNRRIAEEHRYLAAENAHRPMSPEAQTITNRIAELKDYQEWVKLCQSGVFA